MSFNSANQFTANHKVWDHVGNITPDIEHCEGERPAHEFKPAAWLPVQFYDKHYENYVVIMPGKCVSLDPDGRLMPSEYGLTGASVVYVAADVSAGVIDVSTGVALTAAKTVVLVFFDGTRGSGWTAALAGTADNSTYRSGFMGRFGTVGGTDFVDEAVKYPIGVAPYSYLQWAGGDGFNPAELNQHNYIMQHQAAVLCDYVIKLPLLPGQVASETVDATLTDSTLIISTQAGHSRANTQAAVRYDSSTGTVAILDTFPVVALALAENPIAKNTDRTTLALASDNTSDDVSDILVTEKSSPSGITRAGDFYVDTAAGVVFIYSADGATLPVSLSGASGSVTMQYYWYGVAPTNASKFASVVSTTTELKPGDFLRCGTDSNLVWADPTSVNFATIVGQVIALDSNHPRDYLDRVRTAYSPAIGTDSSGSMSNQNVGSASVNTGQLDQMPGSATGGYPDLISFSGAADTIVLINLVSR